MRTHLFWTLYLLIVKLHVIKLQPKYSLLIHNFAFSITGLEGHLTVNYTGTQSFIHKSSHLLANTLRELQILCYIFILSF